jgi:hypothetical protein
MKKAKTAAEAESRPLEALPNVGPAVASYLREVGIHRPADLKGQDPYVLFQQLCGQSGVDYDPCLLDTFIAATRFMAGDEPLPWYHYTKERQKALQAAALQDRPVKTS